MVAGTTTPSAGRPSRRRLYWVAVGVLVAAIALGWFLRERGGPEASVTILPSGHAIQALPGPALDRWIPERWGWLWKLRYAVFGKPASVEVEHTLFHFSSDVEWAFLDANARPALVTSNGVSAWVMELKDATNLTDRFNQQPGVVARLGRVSLGAGTVATVSSSTGTPIASEPIPAGTSVTYAVRQRGNGIEICGAFVSWEIVSNSNAEELRESPRFAMDTNLTMAVSMFVPEGLAVYLRLERTNRLRPPSAAVMIVPRNK